MRLMTKKETMYARIEAHGCALLELFPYSNEKDPVKLCKALRRIEIKAHADAVAYCNGEIDTDQWEAASEKHLCKVSALLCVSPKDVPIFVNGDARGYALKIESSWRALRGSTIHRDWGGHAILAPDLREV